MNQDDLNIQVSIRHIDGLGGFAGYRVGSVKEGEAMIYLNIEACLGTVACGHLSPEMLPNFMIENIMHEVGHAIEEWCGVEFSEERIEALIEKYRDEKCRESCECALIDEDQVEERS